MLARLFASPATMGWLVQQPAQIVAGPAARDSQTGLKNQTHRGGRRSQEDRSSGTNAHPLQREDRIRKRTTPARSHDMNGRRRTWKRHQSHTPSLGRFLCVGGDGIRLRAQNAVSSLTRTIFGSGGGERRAHFTECRHRAFGQAFRNREIQSRSVPKATAARWRKTS
jgi:hypothetical protein